MRKILSFLLAVLCTSGILRAQDAFNMLDFTGTVPDGAEVVTIDGKKYLKISPAEWNTSITIAAINTGSNNKFSFDAKVEAGTYTGDLTKLNVFVKLYNDESEITVGKAVGAAFQNYKSDIKSNTTYTNLQLAFQETVAWAAINGAILYLSPITLVEEAVNEVEPPVTISINKTSAAIEVDGIAEAAWDIASANEVKNLALGTVADANDNSATFKAIWDDTNFYLFVNVTDDDPVEYGTATKAWENDGIEIFFDILDRRYKDGARIANEQHQLRVNLMRQDDSGNYIADESGLGEFTMTIGQQFTSTGYAIELAIPFEGIANNTDFDFANLTGGLKMAFELSVLDANAPDTRKSIINWSNNTGKDVAYQYNQYYGRVILSDGSAVKSLSSNPLKVYPTVSNNSVSVKMDGLTSIELVDLSGKVVLKKAVNASNTEINVSDLSAGVYFIKANSKNLTASEKLIIK